MPRRLLIPILAALLCAAALVAFLWWQVRRAGAEARRQSGNAAVAVDRPEITLDPIDPRDEALLALRRGDLAALKGEWEQAEGEYRKAADAGGGLPALRKLAQAQLQRAQHEDLRGTVERMREAGAKEEDLLLIDAILKLRSADIAGVRELVAASAESPHRSYISALLAIAEGDHRGAQQHLLAVLQGSEPVLRTHAKTLQSAYDEYALYPESPNIHLVTLVARALAQVQECPLAIPLLAQVTAQQDDYRDAWILRGFCDLTTRHPDYALASFEKAYSLDPEKPETQYFLARTYAALGDHRNAVTFLQYALRNGFAPEQEVREVLSREATVLGDVALAMEQYEQLTAFSDAPLEPFKEFVILAVQTGLKDEAVAKAIEATEKWPDDARAFDVLGWAYIEAGDKQQARQSLERALAIDPNLHSAREKLSTL